MARERRDLTLQPTALINEAYVRLIDMRQPDWQNRTHFYALAAQMKRRILVDFARARGYKKRGGGAVAVTLEEGLVSSERGRDLVALDDLSNARKSYQDSFGIWKDADPDIPALAQARGEYAAISVAN